MYIKCERLEKYSRELNGRPTVEGLSPKLDADGVHKAAVQSGPSKAIMRPRSDPVSSCRTSISVLRARAGPAPNIGQVPAVVSFELMRGAGFEPANPYG